MAEFRKVGRRAGLLAAALTLAAAGGIAPHAHQARASANAPGHARIAGDFNGDGFADLAVGIPNANGGRGAVVILYGSTAGLSTTSSQYWTLAKAGISGIHSSASDQFGAAVVAGDYNGDGYADLAVGIPGKNAVVALYGSDAGIAATNSQFLRATGAVAGRSLASGDFNHDGFADLVIGAPFAAVHGVAGAGRIEVHAGSAAGLTDVPQGTAPSFNEVTAGVPGMTTPSTNDNFGVALTTGDFNGDGFDDLAVGIPNGDAGNGAASVLYGSAAGLTAARSQWVPVYGTTGGFAVASGDFNRDGYDDLVIGAPQTGAGATDAGLIEVHPGSASGLTRLVPGAAKYFAEASPGMPGPLPADDDLFGASLAVADFDGDGYVDLAVGIPGKSAAIVLYGSDTGLTKHRSQYVAGIGPQGGSLTTTRVVSLAGADFNRDRVADLAVGEPFATAGDGHTGVVELHSGSSAGVIDVAEGSAPVMSETTAGMPVPQPGDSDFFGFSLAAAARTK